MPRRRRSVRATAPSGGENKTQQKRSKPVAEDTGTKKAKSRAPSLGERHAKSGLTEPVQGTLAKDLAARADEGEDLETYIASSIQNWKDRQKSFKLYQGAIAKAKRDWRPER